MYYELGVLFMLTDKQEKTFQKLKAGELTPSEKADFYYRMSGILKKELEGIKDLSRLMDEMPENHLKKIVTREVAISAMGLTEKLVRRFEPAYLSPIDDKNLAGGRQIIRRYKVAIESNLPGITGAIAHIKASYEPTKGEMEFVRRVGEHHVDIENMRRHFERDPRTYSANEFREEILPKLKSRGQNFKFETEFIIGDVTEKISEKESATRFDKVEKLISEDQKEPK